MSETREGPGWWMAADGGWNPPEMWPEATPPLPGWVRLRNGRWSAPDAARVDTSKQQDGGAVQFGYQEPGAEQIIDLSDAAIAGGHVPQHSSTSRYGAPNFDVVEETVGKQPEPDGPKHQLGLGFGSTEAQPHQVIREVEHRGMTRRRLFLLAVAAIAGAIAGLVLVLVLL